ncbi:hypothetical protein [Shewanella frigidimarina]|uniref:hypothetical protein n=1 Tax=Shewanella frigidimarina TaxID=56812 RepID=UPI003D7ADF2E
MALIKIEQPPIRKITTGAMQSRFTLDEEVTIVDGSDSRAKVLRDRLLNAKCADLDLDELRYGIAYLVNFLSATGVINAPDEVTRTNELLQDGTESERYNGNV